jgi:microcystin-dependent protein
VAKQLFSNNASSLLAASINPATTVIQVASGAAFPSPTGGNYFVAALVNADGDLEIVKCTSRTGNLLTVVRGQEGTTAQSWVLNTTRVELRLTSGTMDNLLQKSGDTVTGDIDFAANELKNARLTGSTVVVGGILAGTAIRGTENDSSNQIVVPNNGTRATAGGQKIVVETDPVMTRFPTGAIIMWFGSLLSIPTGWALCDGTNGTPDLRGRFVRGAGGPTSLNETGGWSGSSINVDPGGGHTHPLTIGSTALTVEQMPAHGHRIWATPGSGTAPRSLTQTTVGATGDGKDAQFSSYITTTGAGIKVLEETGGGEAHTHTSTLTAASAHQHSVPTSTIVPPYTGIYYIMKVAS